MKIYKRSKFKAAIAMVLCMMMCISMVAVAAPPTATGENKTGVLGTDSTFKVQYLKVNKTEVFDGGVYQLSPGDTVEFETNHSFELNASWSVASTIGFVAGDYVDFELPMNGLITYVVGKGDLNDDYGTWEIYRMGGDATPYRVRFVLADPAFVGTSLDNGEFKTKANMTTQQGLSETGTAHVNETDVDWEWIPPSGGGTGVGVYEPNANLNKKDGWGNSANTYASYPIRINENEYSEWFKAVANGNAGATMVTKNNVVVVDALPTTLRVREIGRFSVTFRAPVERGGPGTGTEVVQSSSELFTVDLKDMDGVKIEQNPGETYNAFYTRITEDEKAPVYGIYEDAAAGGQQTIILNVGNLPSDESFLEIYNRLAGTTFSTFKEFFVSATNGIHRTLPAGSRADIADRWIADSKGVYSDDMKMGSFYFYFTADPVWTPGDLDSTDKSITNSVVMKWNDNESLEDSKLINFNRTVASIRLNIGDIYIVKVDKVTGDAINGVKMQLQKYTGGASNIDDVRADSDGVWSDLGSPVITKTIAAGREGVAFWEKAYNGFYRVVEMDAAPGYEKNSFVLYDDKGNVLEGGIFEMPENLWVKAVADNSRTPVTVDLDVTKELTGRDLADDDFTFELYDVQNDTTETAKNDASGKVTFKALSYNKAGTYNYTLTEVEGTDPLMTYDKNVYDVEVTVTDEDKDGPDRKFAASVKYTRHGAEPGTAPDEAVVFKNKYTTPVDVTLQATKQLIGRPLADEEFSFELYDERGILVETVKNNAAGKIVFTAIEYKAVGTYNYTIKEVIGSADRITYDTTVYDVEVVVTEEGNKLVAVVTYTRAGAAEPSNIALFSNGYTGGGGGGGDPEDPPGGGGDDDDEEEPKDDEDEEEPEDPTPDPTPEPRPEPPEVIVDDNGVPLGEWRWDEDEQTWIFDEFVPLGELDLPATGDERSMAAYIVFLMAALGMAVVLLTGKKAQNKI